MLSRSTLGRGPSNAHTTVLKQRLSELLRGRSVAHHGLLARPSWPHPQPHRPGSAAQQDHPADLKLSRLTSHLGCARPSAAPLGFARPSAARSASASSTTWSRPMVCNADGISHLSCARPSTPSGAVLQVTGSPLAAHSTATTCRFDFRRSLSPPQRFDICVSFDDHYRSRADCESLSKRSNTCPAHSMTVCVHCGALP